uniref:Putative secreted protein n=1 Tax=Ixodes ricinus TaxID=34613 RepID=A0A6B0U551_IXORI
MHLELLIVVTFEVTLGAETFTVLRLPVYVATVPETHLRLACLASHSARASKVVPQSSDVAIMAFGLRSSGKKHEQTLTSSLSRCPI